MKGFTEVLEDIKANFSRKQVFEQLKNHSPFRDLITPNRAHDDTHLLYPRLLLNSSIMLGDVNEKFPRDAEFLEGIEVRTSRDSLLERLGYYKIHLSRYLSTDYHEFYRVVGIGSNSSPYFGLCLGPAGIFQDKKRLSSKFFSHFNSLNHAHPKITNEIIGAINDKIIGSIAKDFVRGMKRQNWSFKWDPCSFYEQGDYRYQTFQISHLCKLLKGRALKNEYDGYDAREILLGDRFLIKECTTNYENALSPKRFYFIIDIKTHKEIGFDEQRHLTRGAKRMGLYTGSVNTPLLDEFVDSCIATVGQGVDRSQFEVTAIDSLKHDPYSPHADKRFHFTSALDHVTATIPQQLYSLASRFCAVTPEAPHYEDRLRKLGYSTSYYNIEIPQLPEAASRQRMQVIKCIRSGTKASLIFGIKFYEFKEERIISHQIWIDKDGLAKNRDLEDLGYMSHDHRGNIHFIFSRFMQSLEEISTFLSQLQIAKKPSEEILYNRLNLAEAQKTFSDIQYPSVNLALICQQVEFLFHLFSYAEVKKRGVDGDEDSSLYFEAEYPSLLTRFTSNKSLDPIYSIEINSPLEYKSVFSIKGVHSVSANHPTEGQLHSPMELAEELVTKIYERVNWILHPMEAGQTKTLKVY